MNTDRTAFAKRIGPDHRVSISRAFTLIELMISIALVLLLILGVNQVFKYTTQAVGAGEAINAAIRSSRAAEAAMASDFANMVPPGNGPNDAASLIICCQAFYGYRNAQDLAGEGTISGSAPAPKLSPSYQFPPGAPYQDLNGDGQFGDTAIPGEVTAPFTYNARNHRLDTVSFFARGLFHRQTGNPDTFVDNMATSEAWIWYGHLMLPDNQGGYVSPLANVAGKPVSPTNNPNNCFGSQLVLGRMAMLLGGSSFPIYDNTGVKQSYIGQSAPTSLALAPLTYDSGIVADGGNDSVPTPDTQLIQSRLDLAETSISDFKGKLLAWLPSHTFSSANASTWWFSAMMDGQTDSNRFHCNPFVAKPMASADMAHASPYFLGGCSQFIVEYAGDYLVQDNTPSDTSGTYGGSYGDFLKSGSDGQIDYILIGSSGAKRKQIIWYGLPRGTVSPTTVDLFNNGDVAPLNMWVNAISQAHSSFIPIGSTFEKFLPTPTVNSANPSDLQDGSPYVCAWGPNDKKPSLIRITLTLEDPTGRLPNGQTYQYVFAVP